MSTGHETSTKTSQEDFQVRFARQDNRFQLDEHRHYSKKEVLKEAIEAARNSTPAWPNPITTSLVVEYAKDKWINSRSKIQSKMKLSNPYDSALSERKNATNPENANIQTNLGEIFPHVRGCHKNWKGNENNIFQILLIFFRHVFVSVSFFRVEIKRPSAPMGPL